MCLPGYQRSLAVSNPRKAALTVEQFQQRAVRAMFDQDLAADCLGLGTQRVGEELRFGYPISVMVWKTAKK